ncbi:hypothetical protein U1Q18_050268, partial [Sarracenia purpurea var. burkii]
MAGGVQGFGFVLILLLFGWLGVLDGWGMQGLGFCWPGVRPRSSLASMFSWEGLVLRVVFYCCRVVGWLWGCRFLSFWFLLALFFSPVLFLVFSVEPTASESGCGPLSFLCLVGFWLCWVWFLWLAGVRWAVSARWPSFSRTLNWCSYGHCSVSSCAIMASLV